MGGERSCRLPVASFLSVCWVMPSGGGVSDIYSALLTFSVVLRYAAFLVCLQGRRAPRGVSPREQAARKVI